VTTLNDLLALLPDNTSGDISAADLRTITTALWNRVNAIVDRPYTTTNSAGPASGKLYVQGGWATPTGLELHDTSGDGAATPWSTIQAGTWLRLDRNDGQGILRLTATGTPVDSGTTGSVSVSVRDVTGTAPPNGSPVTLYVLFEA